MSEQPQTGSDLDTRICERCGHVMAEFCDCTCHLPWDDTYYTKVGADDQI